MQNSNEKFLRILFLNIFAVYEYLEYWNQQYEINDLFNS